MRKALELLGHMEDVDVEWLVENGAKRSLEVGSELIGEGRPISALYILLDGELQVRVGREKRLIATLLSGEIVGEISFVNRTPPTATVLVSSYAQVLEIPRVRLQEHLSEDRLFAARFYFALASWMAMRLRNTVDRLGYGSALPEAAEQNELADEEMEDISTAAEHFHWMLHRLRGAVTAGAVV